MLARLAFRRSRTPFFVSATAQNSKTHELDVGFARGARRGRLMASALTNKAEMEYAVMLAVLNFHAEFMKAHYSSIHVHVCDELIEVALAKTTSIPAENQLARSTEGRALLRQFYQAMFDSCQSFLCKRIEDAIGGKVQNLIADFDPSAGRTTLIIRLQESLTTPTACPSNS
jgi:uncharacterized protein YbcI